MSKYVRNRKWATLPVSECIQINKSQFNRVVNILEDKYKKIPSNLTDVSKYMGKDIYVEIKKILPGRTILNPEAILEFYSSDIEKIDNLAKKLGLPLN